MSRVVEIPIEEVRVGDFLKRDPLAPKEDVVAAGPIRLTVVQRAPNYLDDERFYRTRYEVEDLCFRAWRKLPSQPPASTEGDK